MRRCHGSTAEQLILGRPPFGSARSSLVGAEYRVNVAAGSGNLRLHEKRAGHTPGTEIAHFRVFTRCDHIGRRCRGHGNRAGIVSIVPGCRGSGTGLDHLRVRKCDRSHGERAGIIIQSHADGAALIICHEDRFRIIRNGIVALLIEAELAAVDNHDLVLETDRTVDRRVLLGAADSINIHKTMRSGDAGHGSAFRSALGVINVLIVKDQRCAGHTDVLRRCDAEAVDKSARIAAGVHVYIVDIQVGIQKCRQGVAVAGRNGNNHPLIIVLGSQIVHDVLIRAVIGKALHGRAQGQIARIAIKNNGILDGCHVIGIIGAAFGAEHLHDQQLGVRRHADRVDILRCVDIGGTARNITVRRRDTGHMGAVLALGVA